MCGILAFISNEPTDQKARALALEMSRKQRHRGPDWSGIYQHGNVVLCHERLSIVDPFSGGQPLISPDGRFVLTVNGEIYNHEELKLGFTPEDYVFKTKSDCEVIIPLYERYGANMCQYLQGEFAFCLYDTKLKRIFAARDPIGVNPLYVGTGEEFWMLASEMKALVEISNVRIFPPGHYVSWDVKESPVYCMETLQFFKRWYQPSWLVNPDHFPTVTQNEEETCQRIRESLVKAVEMRCMSDVPLGVLLSGGLDSSLVASIAVKHLRRNHQHHLLQQIPSFCIGLENSPDLAAAQKVADFLQTKHYGFTFTVQEGLDALADVIHAVETFDVTTIRASTPMYLLSRKIKAMGVKTVLSGEGADELFAGYLYFHKAPTPEELHKETVRKVDNLHLYDCNRANKSTMAWGLEVRPPFLDTGVLNVAMELTHPLFKMISHKKKEKYILRKAFDDGTFLPSQILWRQKEQFSDGVGYGWIDALKDFTAKHVTDEELARAHERFPVNPPVSKEAYYYRKVFEQCFPCSPSAVATVPGGFSVACSTPAVLAWDKSFQNSNDPSGRAVQGVHASHL